MTISALDDTSSASPVLDPDVLDSKHLTAIDFVSFSVDGRYIAASLSSGGSESGTVQVYEVGSGRELPDVVPRVNEGTAGGSVRWNAQGTGFYYTRYPHRGERSAEDLNFYQQIYFHRLGEPVDRDTYSLGKDFSKIAETELQSSRDGRYPAATVKIGDGGDMEQWLLRPGHEWQQVARSSDEIKDIVFGFHDDVFLLSNKDAKRGKVLHLKIGDSLDKASTIVPESDVVIQDLSASGAGLLVRDLSGGPSTARFLEFGGSRTQSIPVPPISALYSSIPLEDGTFVLARGGYLSPVRNFTSIPRPEASRPPH